MPRLSAARTLLLLSLPIWGCECGDGGTFSKVVPIIEAEPALVFGEVPIGATKRVFLEVSNVGTAELTISSVDAMMPYVAELESAVVPPGGKTLIDVAFKPTLNERQAGQLVIMSDADNEPQLIVSLSGQGVDGFMTVEPQSIDLQNTTVGTVRAAEIAIENFGVENVEGTILAERFNRPEHFTMTSLENFNDVGGFGVQGRQRQIFELEYQPLEFGEDPGRLIFEICGERCGLEVQVLASAAQSVVVLEPPVIDFGVVGLMETRTEQIRVDNRGMEPLQILEVSSQGGAELVASPALSLPVTLQGGENLGITVEYTPSSAAELQGGVLVRTDDPQVPEARVSVVGRGAGPLFLVQPEQINFGAEREVGTYRRALLMLNAGSSDVRITEITMPAHPEFALADLPGLPVRLGPGESVVVNVAFSPTAIGEYTSSVLVVTDDPENPSVEVPVSAGLTDRLCELEVSPERVGFGLIPPTFIRAKQVRVVNAGDDLCTLNSGDFRAPLEPAISLAPIAWPLALNPGDSFELDFQYAPTTQAEAKANFVMMTDDPVFPERHLTLTGSSEGYVEVYTEPESVDFGAVRPTCSAGEREIKVFNAGTVDVFVEQVDLVSQTSSTSEISISTALNTPYALTAGTNAGLGVSYVADNIGVDTAELEIKLRDFPHALVVPLQGEGAVDPRVTESFKQKDARKVDILFVIDDSCSMSDNQLALSTNIQSFINLASLRQVDFQIGVTTTSVITRRGGLVGPVISSMTPNVEQEFAAQALVGSGGSGHEQGLEGMLRAFTAAEQGLSPNVDLFRVGAGRAVVIVSDEDDQSPANPLFYFNELRRRAPPSGLVVAVVSGQAGGCATASLAPRYESFVTLASGLSESICGNWAQTLQNIGAAAFGLSTAFSLSRPADTNNPIEVRVNGASVPSSEWTYDPMSQSVIFNMPPPEDAEIQVSYTPTC